VSGEKKIFEERKQPTTGKLESQLAGFNLAWLTHASANEEQFSSLETRAYQSRNCSVRRPQNVLLLLALPFLGSIKSKFNVRFAVGPRNYSHNDGLWPARRFLGSFFASECFVLEQLETHSGRQRDVESRKPKIDFSWNAFSCHSVDIEERGNRASRSSSRDLLAEQTRVCWTSKLPAKLSFGYLCCLARLLALAGSRD
jgi:hypothetical protein